VPYLFGLQLSIILNRYAHMRGATFTGWLSRQSLTNLHQTQFWPPGTRAWLNKQRRKNTQFNKSKQLGIRNTLKLSQFWCHDFMALDLITDFLLIWFYALVYFILVLVIDQMLSWSALRLTLWRTLCISIWFDLIMSLLSCRMLFSYGHYCNE